MRPDQFTSLVGLKPYVLANYAIFDKLFQNFNSEQKRRFHKYYLKYLNGCRLETKSVKHLYKASYEDYVQLRSESSGFYIVVALYEYERGFNVEQTDWNNPKFQLLLEKANLACSFANDLYSFPKELESAQYNLDKVFNPVPIIARQEKIGIIEAAEKLVEYTEAEEEAFERIKLELLADESTSDSLKLLIESVEVLIAANYISQVLCPRYDI